MSGSKAGSNRGVGALGGACRAGGRVLVQELGLEVLGEVSGEFGCSPAEHAHDQSHVVAI